MNSEMPRTPGGEVGAGLRLGEVHRARPLTRHHVRQVKRLLRGRAHQLDGVDGALRQQWTQVERHVRRVPHFLDGGSDELRQMLATVLDRLVHAIPARRDELPVRGLEALGRFHGTVGQKLRALAVARSVQRVEHFAREPACLLEHDGDGIGRGFLESGQCRHLRQPGELVHHELHVGERGVIGAHGAVDGRMR
jgi:hypothetical protein